MKYIVFVKPSYYKPSGLTYVAKTNVYCVEGKWYNIICDFSYDIAKSAGKLMCVSPLYSFSLEFFKRIIESGISIDFNDLGDVPLTLLDYAINNKIRFDCDDYFNYWIKPLLVPRYKRVKYDGELIFFYRSYYDKFTIKFKHSLSEKCIYVHAYMYNRHISYIIECKEEENMFTCLKKHIVKFNTIKDYVNHILEDINWR